MANIGKDHVDVARTGPDAHTECVWCYQPLTGPKIYARYRVWSKEWNCYMSVCRKHRDFVIRANEESSQN